MIPFNRASTSPLESTYLSDSLGSLHIAGDGPYTKRCQAFLEAQTGVRRALLTTSCTHALEMSAMLASLEPGDEVIVPAFTFVSTANAFAMQGARVKFADIRPDTLNLDEAIVERLIGERTKAIVAVHYAGVACEMDALSELASRRGIALIEDNAHGLFGKYRGRPLGSFGIMSTQSFHETKNFTCGEGGALLLNDDALVARAEILREKGTDRSRFFRGQVDKYTWVDTGSSYVPSDVLAALLLAQFERADEIQAKRRCIWERYAVTLRDWAASNNVGLPFVPAHCEQSFHMFYLILDSLRTRSALISHLAQSGVQAVFHYLPLQRSPRAVELGAAVECPVTDFVSDRLLRLPFYTDLSTNDQDRVIEAVRSFRAR